MKRRLCMLLTMSLIMTSVCTPTVYGYEQAAISAQKQESAAVFAASEGVASFIEVPVSYLNGIEDETSDDPDDSAEAGVMNRAPKARCFQGDERFALGKASDSSAYRKSGELGRAKLSQREIIEMFQSIPTMNATEPERYSEEPSTESPYSEGKLSKEYLEAAGAYLNYIRNLSGLRNTKLNDSLNASAQQAALVNAANGSISHTPSQPKGMDSSLYQKGAAAARSSNLYKHSNKANSTLLKTSLISYMDDNNSESNLECLGHRRWVLCPNLAYTGFGQAEKGTMAIGAMKDFESKYDSVNPIDSTSINYDFISWPSSGNFPIHKTVFSRNVDNLMWKNIPWSVTLNPTKYKVPSASSLTIQVTRLSDGKSWNFGKSDVNSSPSSNKLKYMLVNTENYGVANCIIFNLGSEFTDTDYNRRAEAPDEKEQMFQVCISGLKTSSGASTQINYRINFFDIADPDTTSQYYDSGECFNEAEETLPPEIPGEDDPPSDDPSGDEPPADDSVPVDKTGVDENKAIRTVCFVSGSTVVKQVTALNGDLLCDVMKDMEMPLPSSAGLSDDEYGFAGWYSEGDASGLLSKGCLVDGSTAVSQDVNAYSYFKRRIPGVDLVDLGNSRSAIEIGAIRSVAYDGTYQTPDVSIKVGKNVLCRGEDYLLTYENNRDVGRATVTIHGIGAYSGTKTASFQITPRQISDADVWFEDVNGVSEIHSASDSHIRGHFVDFDGSMSSEDYTISSVTCVPNATGGKVTVIVTGKGKYRGTVKCMFNCYSSGSAARLISNGAAGGLVEGMEVQPTAEYDAERKCYVYTGGPIKPSVTIPGLTPKVDYTIKYRNNKNAGLGVVIIAGKGAYKGTYRLYFHIGKRDLSTGSVAAIPTKVYKGAPQRMKPKVSVRAKDKLLKPKVKKDYTVVYSDALNAGSCSVTVQGIKNYMGSLTTEMKIAPASVAKMKFAGLTGQLSGGAVVLTGTPAASFGKAKNLVQGYDYELGDITYDSVTGKAFVEVRGLHNFTGTASKPVILPKAE